MQRGAARGMRKPAATVAQEEHRSDRGPLWGRTPASKGSQKGRGEPAGLPGRGWDWVRSLSSWCSSRLCLSHLPRQGRLGHNGRGGVVSSSLAPLLAGGLSRSRAVCRGLWLELVPTQEAASPAWWLFLKEEGGLYPNDALQKKDMGKGEALLLVETALGQSRSLEKAWSHQPCAVPHLWLFSWIP